MKTKAAVAWKAGEKLSIEEAELEGPHAGECWWRFGPQAFVIPTLLPFRARTRRGSFPPSSAMKARALCWKSAPA